MQTVHEPTIAKTFLDADGRVSYSVPSCSRDHLYYRVTDNGCTCETARFRPWQPCKHVLAVRVHEDRRQQEAAF